MPIERQRQPKPVGPCTGCGKPIYRNLAFLNGLPWHYGELKETEEFGQASYFCRSCSTYLTRGKVGLLTITGFPTRTCGMCGSSDIVWIRNYPEQIVEVHYP